MSQLSHLNFYNHLNFNPPLQQVHQQDVCVQPQKVGVEGSGWHGDAQGHVWGSGAQGQDYRGGWGQRQWTAEVM